ncbi:hypothetical protein JTB14_025309 [Gonioctena quinquepunctata]|nr:hypothetical protein JTB14_025309 [Gonioctena quinquepunctata]
MLLAEEQISETLAKIIDDYTDDKSKNEFTMKDSKAKSMIVQYITDKHLDLVKDSKSSKEIMKALQDVFERKSVFTKLTLKKKSPAEAYSGETPAQRWYKKNDLFKMRVFGSQAWAAILPRQRKLEKRAQSYTMVGYTGARYRLWNYGKNEIISSRDVRFNERNTNYNEILKNTKDEDSRKIIQIQENFTESTSSDNFEECLPKTNETNSGRKINPPKYLEEYEVFTAYCLISSSECAPSTYKDAVKDKEWKEAIEKELNSHTKLNTWTEAKLPEGKTAIQTRWVFRIKEDGTEKARVVAKGFQLKEGEIPVNKIGDNISEEVIVNADFEDEHNWDIEIEDADNFTPVAESTIRNKLREWAITHGISHLATHLESSPSKSTPLAI